MTQKWDTTSHPASVIGDDVDAILQRLIDGVNTSTTFYYGDSDPDDGTWAASQVGRMWLDSTNDIVGGGDDRGAVWKVWSILAVTPTYGWREIGVRALNDESPNSNKLDLSSQSTTAFTNCDVSGDLGSYGVRAIAVLLVVTVEDSGTPASGVYAEFRTDGVTTDDRAVRVYPQAAGVPNSVLVRIPLAVGIFEYAIEASGAGTFDLRVDIVGWEERAT